MIDDSDEFALRQVAQLCILDDFVVDASVQDADQSEYDELTIVLKLAPTADGLPTSVFEHVDGTLIVRTVRPNSLHYEAHLTL